MQDYKRKFQEEQESLSLSSQLEACQIRCEKLERDRQFLYDKNQQTIVNWTTEKETLSKAKQDIESKLVECMKENATFKENLAELKSTAESHVSQLVYQLQNAQEEIASLKSRNSNLLKECEKLSKVSVTTSHASTPTKVISVTSEPMQRQMKENMEYIKKLESQIRQLKSDVSNYQSVQADLETKKEEIASLTNQLASMATLRTNYAQVMVEKSNLLAERAKWIHYCESETNLDPITISRALANSKLEATQLKEQLEFERAHQIGKNHYLSQLEKEARELKATNAQLLTDSELLKQTLNQAQRQSTLLSRETELLRHQVKSFEFEASVSGATLNRTPEQTAHLEKLEALLADYKSALAERNPSPRVSLPLQSTSNAFSPDVTQKMEAYQSGNLPIQ